MSFAAVEYLPYLALVVAVFQFVPRAWRMGTLLVASWLFYADWRPAHLAVLVGSTLVGHATALAMQRSSSARARRAWFALSIAFHLALLAVFKYAGFLSSNADWFARALGIGRVEHVDFALPLGLSFYSLQVISYSIDVYRRRMAPCAGWIEFPLFVAFFPQLVAGPIERAERLVPQLRATEALTWANLERGALAIAWGLAKKQVIADRLRAYAFPIVEAPSEHGSTQVALAAVALLVMLYADFSAYSDIAVGSARLFGIELTRNFRRPFAATTPLALWQRWHISLWTWLVDYVQVPLARRSKSRLALWRNTLIVLVLVGLWHGASWNFVLWGVVAGAFVLPYQITQWRPRTALAHALSWLVTVGGGAVVMVLFFTPSLAAAGDFYGRVSAFEHAPLRELDVVFLAALPLLFAAHLAGELRDLERDGERIGVAGRLAFLAAVIAFTVALRVPESPAFVYFQF